MKKKVTFKGNTAWELSVKLDYDVGQNEQGPTKKYVNAELSIW